MILPGIEMTPWDIAHAEKRMCPRFRIVCRSSWSRGFWCFQIHHLRQAHDELGSRNLAVIGMVFNDSEQNITAIVENRNVTWSQVFDPSGETGERFKVRGIPDPVLIDPNGIVVERGSSLRGKDLMVTLSKYIH